MWWSFTVPQLFELSLHRRVHIGLAAGGPTWGVSPTVVLCFSYVSICHRFFRDLLLALSNREHRQKICCTIWSLQWVLRLGRADSSDLSMWRRQVRSTSPNHRAFMRLCHLFNGVQLASSLCAKTMSLEYVLSRRPWRTYLSGSRRSIMMLGYEKIASLLHSTSLLPSSGFNHTGNFVSWSSYGHGNRFLNPRLYTPTG